MAIGKKTGGRNFKPGNKANPKGRPALPADIKGARELNKIELDRMLNKCVYLTLPEIKALASKRNKESPIIEMIVAKILHKAYEGADQWRAEFILQRLLGRVPNQAPPPELPSPMARDVSPPVVLSFDQFCVNARYPRPYPKQLEMRAFAFDEIEARLLLGSRNYGKTDYLTVLGVAYDIYLNYMAGLHRDKESATTNLIITKSKQRNTALIEEVANGLEANGVKLSKANASCVDVEGLVGKDNSVEAITIKTSMRGRHPKRIIMDDPVTEEDVSAAMRALVKRKYDEAYKLCNNILVIGQPAHADDLYAGLRPILKKMEIPWGTIPELDADLEAMEKAGIDRDSIQMSYHLKVPTTGSMPFSNVKYIDRFPDGGAMAFIDPSEGGDYTALSIIKGLMDGVAVYGKVWKRAWYHCTDEMGPILKARGVTRVCFETNSTGKQPIGQLQQLWGPLGIGVVGKNSDTNKHACIMSAGSYAHLIHLSRDSDATYTNQVIKYEYGVEFDDAPDSLARCLEWIGLIKGKPRGTNG